MKAHLSNFILSGIDLLSYLFRQRSISYWMYIMVHLFLVHGAEGQSEDSNIFNVQTNPADITFGSDQVGSFFFDITLYLSEEPDKDKDVKVSLSRSTTTESSFLDALTIEPDEIILTAQNWRSGEVVRVSHTSNQVEVEGRAKILLTCNDCAADRTFFHIFFEKLHFISISADKQVVQPGEIVTVTATISDPYPQYLDFKGSASNGYASNPIQFQLRANESSTEHRFQIARRNFINKSFSASVSPFDNSSDGVSLLCITTPRTESQRCDPSPPTDVRRGRPHTIHGTILVGEIPQLVLPDTVEVTEGETSTFDVKLENIPVQDVTVSINGYANTSLDTTASDPRKFKFSSSARETSKLVTVGAKQDANYLDEVEKLIFNATRAGDPEITDTVYIKILDDDLSNLIIMPPSIEIREGSYEIFNVSLSAQPSDSVTVTIPKFSNADLTRTPKTLTFTTSNYGMSQPIRVSAAQDDNAIDESEILTLTASGGGFDSATEQVTVNVDDDDEASLRVQPKHISMIEGDSAKFEVFLLAQPTGTVTVTIPPFTNTDLTRTPETLTFTTSNYGTAQLVTIMAEQDDDIDGESEMLTLTALGGEYEGVTEDVSITVLDPSVRLLATPLMVFEGETVELTAEVSQVLKTNLLIPLIYEETGTDPATEFVDYDGPPSITISAGQPTGSEQISIRNDMTAEANETFRVKLGPFLPPPQVDPGNPSMQVITILNDDEPPPVQASLSVQPNPVNEGESVTVTATLARMLDETITIPVVCTALGTTDSDDYICPPSVTIPAEARSGNAVLGARIDEDTYDEQVSVALGTHPIIEIGPPNSITLTILDTTPAVVTLSVSPREVEEGGKVTVTVMRSGVSPIPVMIPVECSSTENYEYECPTEIRILAGETSGSANIIIQDDDMAEDDQTFIVALGSVLSPEMEAGDPSSQQVTIRDNDQAGIDLLPPSLTVVEGSSADYTIRLSSEPQAPVTLVLDERSGRITWSPPVLTFTSSNWNSPQGVMVEAPRDNNTDSESTILTHTARSADSIYNGRNEDLPVHVIDRDTENFLIRPEELSVPEDNSREFTVALATEPSGFVTVQITPFSNLDLTRAPAALTFTPSNWDMEQPVRISAAADDDAESDAAETLMLVASGGGYNGVSGEVRVTVQEKDSKRIQLSPTSLTVEEGGGPSTYMVALTSAPTSNVEVTISGQGAKATLNPAYLMFTPSDWNIPKLVNVQAVEDSDADDEMIRLLHMASGGGYDQVDAELSLRIQDQGENLITISLYDAQAHEAEERVNLRVELNEPTALPVSVRYKTIAGTAEAESDYVRSRGIVFFDLGSKKGKIQVEVVNDEMPELEERFTVELSGARNATIARPVGQVTILDDDASATMVRIDDASVPESDPMVRFTVHLSAPSAVPILVHYRTENGTASAGEDYHAQSGVLKFAPGELAHEIEVDLIHKSHNKTGKTFVVRLENTSAGRIENAIAMATIQGESTPIALEVMEMYTTRFVRTSTIQIVEALRERHRSMSSSCLAGRRADLVQVWGTAWDWKPSLGELLAGCQVFQEQERERGWLSVWGRGTFTRFQGREVGALNFRGEVTTAMLGTDYRWQSGWLAGVLVAHSRGDGSFRVLNQSGPLQAALTGVIPYLSIQRVDWGAWMALGYGRGQTEVEALEGRLASVFGAAGVRGTWMSNGAAGLTVHGDVLITGAEVEEHDVRGEVVRIRVGIEGAIQLHETIRPYVEANVRQDGGDAETGIGLELGGGVRLSSGRLRAEVRTHGLVMHTADGFTEWGTSGVVQIGRGPMGWALSIRPSWGLSHGGSLYRQLTILDATRIQANVYRTEMELAYGTPFRAGVARPVVGVTQLSTGRIYRMGTDLRPWDQMSFSLFGLIHSQRELGLNVRGTLNY